MVRITPERYQGKIWCIRVPTGSFVAVRNGKAFPTGNSGFPKGRTQLKPAFEPICLAYKPGGKRTLQVDECRVGFTSNGDEREAKEKNAHADFGDGPRKNRRVYGDIGSPRDNYDPPGRWPANVCHDGSAEVMEAFAAFGNAGGGIR